jgi:hypothetical protein
LHREPDVFGADDRSGYSFTGADAASDVESVKTRGNFSSCNAELQVATRRLRNSRNAHRRPSAKMNTFALPSNRTLFYRSLYRV